MDFALSEEQKELQKWAHEFAEKEIRPVAGDYDETEEFPWPVVAKAVRGGYDGRGVWIVDKRGDLPDVEVIVEEKVPLRRELSALVAEVPKIAISAVNLLSARRNRHLVRFSVVDCIFTRLDLPLTPWSDHFELWRQCLKSMFKTDLIIAFAGAAMGYRSRAFLQSHFDLGLRQNRTRKRGAEQIFIFVHRSRF